MSEPNVTTSTLTEEQEAQLSILRIRQQISDADTYEECEASDIVTDLDNDNGDVPTIEEAFPTTIADHSLEGYWDASNFSKVDIAWPFIRSNFSEGEGTFAVPDGSQKPPTTVINQEINGKPSLGFNNDAGVSSANAVTDGRYISYICLLMQSSGWTDNRTIIQGVDWGEPYLVQDGTTPIVEATGGVESSALTQRSTPFDKSWFIVEILTTRDGDVDYATELCITNLKTGASTSTIDTVSSIPPEFAGMVVGYGGEGSTPLSAQFQIAALIMYSVTDTNAMTQFPDAQRTLIKAYLTSFFGGMTLPLLYTEEQNGTPNQS